MLDQSKLKRLKKAGLFTTQDASKKYGISQPTLSRLAKRGVVERVGRGLYQHSDADNKSETIDFAVACLSFGRKSAIGGLSALFYYGLIEQVPGQIWVIVPPTKRNSRSLYRCVRIRTSFHIGVEQKDHFRITNVERTLIEALKFAGKIGPRIAIQATRKAIKDGLTSEVKLGQMARRLHLDRILERYWEAIVT